MMYKLFRDIHLYSALIISAFVLMYFVTGGVMVFDNYFNRMNAKVETSHFFIGSGALRETEIRRIMATNDIRGRQEIRHSNGSIIRSFRRPGFTAELRFKIGKDSVELFIRQGNFGAAMNDLHRLRGYRGGLRHFVWGFMYDLSCISLLLFAFTGLYLWWKHEKRRWIGAACLSVSATLTGFTFWYLNNIC